MKALFIVDHLDGTIRVRKEPSWNTPENVPNQLAKFDMDNDVLPTAPEGVPQEFWAWDGAQVVEASQAVQDAITGAEDAATQAEHDDDAPSGDLSGWSKREKCLLLITYKLAQQHWPSMTKEQFLDNVKAEWDSLK